MIVALTCYNRLDTLKKTIDSLMGCWGVEEVPIYYFADGGENVEEVREYIAKIKRPIDKIFLSSANHGLRGNTLTAIVRTSFDDEHIIWLQDDMEFSKDFLEFMSFALNEYEDDKEIMFVSGYTPILHHSNYLSSYFSEAVGIWRSKFSYTDKIDDPEGYRKFAGDMFYNQLLNAKDVISVYLSYSMYKKQAYCLHPNRNKLRHLVTDSTNCKKKVAKKLNQNLYEGFSKRIDSGIMPTYYKYSLMKKITRWIRRKLK